MGGGGGGGDANNLDPNNLTNAGVKGGVGGGIILINVGKIIGVGTILCNGGNGQVGATGLQPDGAGGGGAGGTVYLKVSNPDPSAVLTIEAKGGIGGSTADAFKPPHGPGGGGGGGEIFYAMSQGSVTPSVLKGNAGKTESGAGILHGASDGTDGNVIPFLIASLPPYLQGGGSACFPELTTTLFEANPAAIKYPGSTVLYTIKAHNYPAGGNAGGVQIEVQLPAGIVYKSATKTYIGESGGPAVITNIGTANKPKFGDFNISPGDDVLINLTAEVSCSQNPGTYSANAQSIYLDPSRTFSDPNRRITSSVGAFSNTNTTYETLSTPVPGGNFDGNTSIIDNVVVQAPAVLANNNINIPNSQIKFCVTSVGDLATPGLITGSLPTGDTNEYTYQWRMSADNINFQDIPSATDINYNPGAISTTAYFRRLVKGHCTPQPLTSNTIKIEVNVKPVADFETPDFCLADGTAIFNNLSTIADGTVNQLTYLWNFGDPNSGASNTSTQKIGSHSYSASGDYVVTLAVTSNNGCIADVKTRPFTVNGSTPKANFKVRNELKLCSANALEFDDLATVDFGQITKIEWYYDYLNNPADVVVDNNPGLRASTRPPYAKQYPVFTSPATKKYKVRMVAYSGASCVNSIDYEITLNAMPIVEFNAIPPVCVNEDSFLLTQGTETTGIAGQGTYSGNGVSPSGFFDPALAGSGTHIITYTFKSTAGQCSDFKTQQIIVHPTPIMRNTSIEILEGGAITLPAITSETGLTYQWAASNTLSQTNILRPVANPTEDVTYTLTATDKVTSCTSVGKIDVLVHKIPKIPNTFTPNADGTNDFWIIGYLETYPDCTVNVFNRNGKVVFNSVGYASPWDGRYKGAELSSGTYFYIIDPKIGRKPMAGSVTIIR